MGTDLIFELSETRKTQVFSFKNSYSYISIKRIIISSLLGLPPDEWFSKLTELGLHLKITCTKNNGEKFEYPVYLQSHISPYHAQPIIEFIGNFIIPEQNKINISAFLEHFNKAVIELSYKDNVAPKVGLTFVYEKTPGAEAKADE